MATVGSFEAKTHLAALLERARNGERITITNRGVPVAVLGPAEGRPAKEKSQVIEEMSRFRFAKSLTADGETLRDLVDEGRRF